MDKDIAEKFQKVTIAESELLTALCKLNNITGCQCTEPNPFDFGRVKGKDNFARFICMECGGIVPDFPGD